MMNKTRPSSHSMFFSDFPAPLEKVSEYTRKYSRTVHVEGYHVTKAFLKTIVFFSRRLSWNTAYRIGTWIGMLLYHLRIRKSVAMINLDIVYGNRKTFSEKDRIYRECLINFGRFLVNYLRLPYMDESFWKHQCEWENEDLFKKAINQKKGVILISGHIGMIDLAGGKLGMCGYPVSAIARRIKNPAADAFVIHTRNSMNFGSIRHRNSMKRILRGIKQGEAIVIVLDQDVKPYVGIFIEWLGRRASTVHAGAYIAKKTGAPVIAGYFYQQSPDKFKLVFTEEVAWESCQDDPEREIVINTQKQADAVQKIIYAHPELWFWIHRRWKTQPKGIPNPYKVER